MQVSDPIRSSHASRIQQPISVSQHPILFASSRPPPAQYPMQYSNFQQQIPSPLASFPPRTVDPGTSFHTLPPILYPQYQQPLYPTGQPYLHPQFLAQPVTVVRRPPANDPSPAFESAQGSQLCEAKIVENTIFCVVCGAEYKTSEKDQHIQKHTRKGQERRLNQQALQRLERYHKQENKVSYLVKPIVEPEEIDVQFDPNVFEVIQEIIYEDESLASKQEAGTGQQANNNSFSYFDNNVSISHNQPLINPTFDSEPNPFFSKHTEPHQYEVPQFEIPAAPLLIPVSQEVHLADPNDHPLVYDNELPIPHYVTNTKQIEPHPEPVIPAVNTLNTYYADVAHLVEEAQRPTLHQGKTSQPPPEQPIYQSEHPSKVKASLFSNQNAPEYRSQRYESADFRGFPQEEIEKINLEPIERQDSFSGPIEIRASNDHSKKSTEVNVSQFIRDLNAENEGLVVESRTRIPNQSEW